MLQNKLLDQQVLLILRPMPVLPGHMHNLFWFNVQPGRIALNLDLVPQPLLSPLLLYRLNQWKKLDQLDMKRDKLLGKLLDQPKQLHRQRHNKLSQLNLRMALDMPLKNLHLDLLLLVLL